MKVLIAAAIYPPDSGGPAIHAKRQYDWLRSHGVKTRLSALAHYRKLPKFIRHWIYLASLIVKSFGADVVYAHDAVGAGMPAAIVAKILGIKLVVRVGGDLAWEREVQGEKIPLLEWYESGSYKEGRFFKLSLWSLQKADKIIVPSPILSDIYSKYYEIPPERIQIIPNPLPEISSMSVTTTPIIIYASRLVAYKNLDLVLRVLSKIFPAHPELKFIVMGDGPEKDNLEKLTEELGIASQVVFKGNVPQEEVLKETAKSLFTLAPAVTEFNPNYVLQGLAYGKPFIISRGNGLPFEVPEEFLFDHRSEAELQTRIENLLVGEQYTKAVEKVKAIDLKVTWEDNMRLNHEAITALLNGSK